MDTSSRTKSVERPVRAVDLFIASLDALTLLEGSSTLSAQIDSDERATLLASFGRPVCRTNGGAEGEGIRERKRETSHREQTGRRKGIASTRESAKRSKRREKKEKTS